jgi:hypothetical protein
MNMLLASDETLVGVEKNNPASRASCRRSGLLQHARIKMELDFAGDMRRSTNILTSARGIGDCSLQELKGYKITKSAIQFAADKPIPVGLVRRS